MLATTLILLFLLSGALPAATFGTVVPLVGGASDIVLDEARDRLYLVNGSQDRLEVYSITQRRFLTAIRVDSLPLSAAMSADRRLLYVACHNASSIVVVNLDTQTIATRISLPARPEGIAVGNDERVLITTIGTGPNNSQNILLVYDPNASGSNSVQNVVFAPPAPQSPLLPPPSGRVFLAGRSRLETSPDGRYIVGVNIPNNNQRAVFVYEVASATVLRSRTVASVSSVLSIAPDSSRAMVGLNLFDLNTLEILAQQNLANAPYPIPPNTNFNLQQNQGGSVFAPDGSFLYSAFNVAPFTNPATRPNVSQLMINDPDNLLINTALQMPENLSGKMVITADGGTIFAISESGFTIIPISQAPANPIAMVDSPVVLLANDQCGVTEDKRRAAVTLQNAGRGRLTATAQVLQFTPTGPGGLGGAGGPGGGVPGGGVIIVVPAPLPGGGGATPPTAPGLPTAQNTGIVQTAPQVRTQQSPDGPTFEFTFNTLNTRSLGTVSPIHDFLIQSNEAINIPPRIRVFQNNRDADARADTIPVPVGISANEALEDLVFDQPRARLYIANSGMNRVEVFDTRARRFLAPIKVGQLPRSLALMPDGNTLYVANSGGESISIVDLQAGQVVGRVRFPPLPFNAASPLITPSVIAPSVRGPLILMNNGTLWRVVGDEALPRAISPTIGSATISAPRSMAATPNGEYVLLMAGNGFVYLYDANADEFVQGRQVFNNPIQGYYGPVAAGPRGQYYLVNGTVLNQALTPVNSAGTVVVPGQGGATNSLVRPVSAVATASATTFVRFAQPVRVQANNPLVSDTPMVELVDVNTGNVMRSVPAVEGPVSIVTGNARANVSGRTMAVDMANNVAFMITASGLSIVPLDPVAPADRPVLTPNATVNIASRQTAIAPGNLVAINGRNLAAEASTSGAPLPTILGGVCVTLNNRPLPLSATSGEQINAQVPPDLAAGRYPLVVRSIERKASSQTQQVTVSRYAPAVLVDPESGQAAIYRQSDGKAVTKDRPAKRDQRLMMFAVGLGATKGPRITAGQATPSEPPAVTDPVSVYFGDPRYSQAQIIVEWSGLVPGLVGLYQVNLYVPGNHLRGPELPVTLRIGGVSSPTTGPVVPTIAVD